MISNLTSQGLNGNHRSRTLYLLPALRAGIGRDGAFILTRKFIDGASAFAAQWPGEVVVLIQCERAPSFNLDLVEARSGDLPFQIEPLPADEGALADRLRGEGVVFASLVDTNLRLGEICAGLAMPLVVYSEYSLNTRRQIARVRSSNPLLKLRRQWWESRYEKRAQEVIRTAAGVQCNGTPTFDVYRSINPRPLLYFDTRMTKAMLAQPEEVAARAARLGRNGKQRKPLRLAFSGRLTAVKGADHLPIVAAELMKLGVNFSMDVCGDGDLAMPVAQLVEQLHLADRVRMRGVLDFHRQLVPLMKSDIDLFVCCHRQGDPSCTYLETMACGTPIVGYDNEAFTGLARESGVGWLTPMDDPAALARKIAELNEDRKAIAQAAHSSLAFASRHTFESVVRARMEHVAECCDAQCSSPSKANADAEAEVGAAIVPIAPIVPVVEEAAS